MGSVGRMMAWVGVALGAVYLIYIGGAWWGIYASGLRVATMLIAALTLATWAWVAYRNPAWRPKSVMLPAILACLGSLAISTVFSRVPRVSLEYLGYAIVLAALYLLLVRLFAEPFFRRRLAVLATLLFVVTIVAFLVRVGLYWAHWWDLLGRVALPPLRPGFEGLTYNNPSAVLTMVALLAVPAAATFGAATRRGMVHLGIILFAVALVALLSGSRAGWFALALTGVIGPVVWLVPRPNRQLLGNWVGRFLDTTSGRVAATTLGLATIGLAAAVAPAVLQRANAGGEPERITYAVAALRMFEASPLVGTGPGTWVIQRAPYTAESEPDYYIPHAHNLEVQTLAELGLVGAIAGIVLLLNLVWLFRSATRSSTVERRRWALFGGLGLLYFLIHQVLDFYLNMPAFLFAAALSVAYLDATTTADDIGSRWPKTIPARVGGLGLAVLAVAIGGLLWQEIAASRQAEAVAAANTRDWQSADAPARAAAAMDPEINSYQLTAGLTASWAGDHAAAVTYFTRVANRDDLPEAWLDLAAEQAAIGEDDRAVESIRRALRLGYQRPVVAMPAGDLALRLGSTELAVGAFESALGQIPSLAGDPWWRQDQARAAAFDAAVARALSTAPAGIGWELALMAGDVGRAKAIAAADSSALRLIQAWEGDLAATNAILARCEASPLDLYWLLWCARLEGRRGNIDRADELRDMANTAVVSTYHAGAEMRVSETGMTGAQLLGDPADLWATYTYRRPAPWDILVPSLIHLRIE